jgi:hypothetical protein
MGTMTGTDDGCAFCEQPYMSCEACQETLKHSAEVCAAARAGVRAHGAEVEAEIEAEAEEVGEEEREQQPAEEQPATSVTSWTRMADELLALHAAGHAQPVQFATRPLPDGATEPMKTVAEFFS